MRKRSSDTSFSRREPQAVGLRSKTYREWTFEGGAERLWQVGIDGVAPVTRAGCMSVRREWPPFGGKLGGTAEFLLPRQQFLLSGLFYLFRAAARERTEDHERDPLQNLSGRIGDAARMV